ncbi:hypothetical protein [Formosa sp. A9]|uniref:hypothetical protein n=1 Tax=Formosa sp. A9 TaxID=3442641 RepID=UPI003EB84686
MTKTEFGNLEFGKKMNTISTLGQLVGQLQKDHESLLCYAVDKFFVEVIYETETHDLLRLVVFEGGRQLDKYSNLKTEI